MPAGSVYQRLGCRARGLVALLVRGGSRIGDTSSKRTFGILGKRIVIGGGGGGSSKIWKVVGALATLLRVMLLFCGTCSDIFYLMIVRLVGDERDGLISGWVDGW